MNFTLTCDVSLEYVDPFKNAFPCWSDYWELFMAGTIKDWTYAFPLEAL